MLSPIIFRARAVADATDCCFAIIPPSYPQPTRPTNEGLWLKNKTVGDFRKYYKYNKITLYNMKYEPKKEIKVDLNNPKIKKAISDAKTAYEKFAKRFLHKLDLKKPNTIKQVYEQAKKENIFDKAQEIRELIFGKDIHFYGVVYLWDKCCNYCIYCPGSVQNREKAIKQGKEYPLRELSVQEAVRDTKAVMEDGHTHVCYLTGEWPGVEFYPQKMAEYLKELDKLGLQEIILNIPPQNAKGFKIIRNAVKKTSIQFRVFQETYNKKVYAEVHPKGPKSNYNFRIESQARALEAEFDNVGLGALFCLNQYPIEEINGLQKHAETIKKKFGKYPIRVCLPTANFLEGIGVTVPFIIPRGEYDKFGELVKSNYYELFDELIFALGRLAMPTINIVSSERDPYGMLKILDKYATCTTLDVHPGVGDNIEHHKTKFEKINKEYKSEAREVHFEQATVFPREPKTTIEDMKKRGYNPILGKIEEETKHKKDIFLKSVEYIQGGI
jgi:biotin synthase-like enzyme